MARMMRIHEDLVEERFPNCSRLADVFEVSYKTVQRDIDFMRDQLLLPIDYDQIRHGFHYTKPVSKFPLMSVSQGELVALLVAQKAIEQYRGTSFEKPLRSAFQKLASSLDSETNVSLHELSEAVSFRNLGVPAQELKNYERLADAVLTRHVVEFDYLGLKAVKPERRRVEPLHLACIEGQWYLVAQDLVRTARRSFALTRIRKVRHLKKQFRRPENFSMEEMFADSFSAFEGHSSEKVVIDFDNVAARIVSERRWHKSQNLQPRKDGGLRLTMTVGIAPDLEKWILGWGARAEVMEPRSLRDRVAASVRECARKYAG